MKSDVFKIAVPEEILDDLKERLRRTRWADDMVLGWDGGTDPQYLRELVSYWLKHFDWRRQESRLNSFSHYRAEVEDQVIHFIHQRSSNPKALPLIITHGWPGSFVE
ncbi:MAG TPA: epoxide hydrolase N-terminal domain-containing protein, partial [Acidobacteriota bacterium]|nr:epoxide hydrolase N-terminal domain-containing protein [Acidobacteriota bacterium]